MRRRYRYDADLECLVEVGNNANYFEETPKGPNLIRDDMGAGVNGLRAMYREDRKHFDSKSAYRRDVKAHGLAEVGNEKNFASKPPAPDKYKYHRIVKESWEKFDGNYNGTADQTRRSEQVSKWRRENG